MARLIVKSPYIKGGSAGGYLKYIGTREGVELLPDDRPPTRKQEQLIAKLTQDFPDTRTLAEFSDYAESKTKYNASQFITKALEKNWSAVSGMEGYAGYIATRPRAQRLGDHGLFGDEDRVDLDAVMAELQSYPGNVWTHILSLSREDAQRLGYDNIAAWRELLRAHRSDIASAMKIPPRNFRWYAAFHDEGHHPHVHMMAWSAVPGEAYLSRDGLRQIKSQLTNHIFRQEILETYERKSQSRDELVREARKSLSELVREMETGIAVHPEVERLISDLAEQLPTGGKLSYGYLPKKQKRLVDEIVDEMERLDVVREAYEKWCELQWQVESYYHDRPREKKKLSEQKEFRSIKNAVIRVAAQIRGGTVTFEDRGLRREDEAEERQDDYDLSRLRDAVLDESLPIEQRDAAVEMLTRYADTGDPWAQLYVGRLYRDGGILLPDAEPAVRYFRDAAEQGLAAAQYALGKLLLEDEEVRAPEEGLRWLAQAAENGNSYAAYRLGKEYLTGRNTERDPDRAIDRFKQAADAGNRWAQYTLGKLCLMENREQARHNFTQAAEQGHPYAQFFLDRMEEHKHPSVMLAASQLLYHIGRIFRDNTPLPPGNRAIRMDRKRFQELVEQKGYHAALNHAHEAEEDGGQSMRSSW